MGIRSIQPCGSCRAPVLGLKDMMGYKKEEDYDNHLSVSAASDTQVLFNLLQNHLDFIPKQEQGF